MQLFRALNVLLSSKDPTNNSDLAWNTKNCEFAKDAEALQLQLYSFSLANHRTLRSGVISLKLV